MKYMQPVIIALLVAIISAAGSMMYRHEGMLADQLNAHKTLSNKVYRTKMRAYDYHDSLVSAQLQMMELNADAHGDLSIAEKAWVSYLKTLKGKIESEMSRATEEEVNSGTN